MQRRPDKITLDSRGVFKKRRIRMNWGVSRNIDDFSCEGEVRVRTGKSRMADLLDALSDGIEDILKGYEPPTGRTNGYVLGVSKMEHRVSDSFLLNCMRESIVAD